MLTPGGGGRGDNGEVVSSLRWKSAGQARSRIRPECTSQAVLKGGRQGIRHPLVTALRGTWVGLCQK